jgi:hypothetical protein
MANRENHEKRTNLYDKALTRRPELNLKEQLIRDLNGGKGPGTFIVKPSSITDPGDGSPLIADPGGTKWLPPKKDD